MNHATVRSLLLAVLIIGSVGSIGPGTTYSLFTDTHEDTSTMSAADNFNRGGNGGSVTADAGGPYTVAEGGTIELNADGDGISGNSGSYEWEIVSSAGDDSLSSATGEEVMYSAPTDVSGDTTAEAELTVTDNQGNTATDTATITISDGGSSSCGGSELRFSSVGINGQEGSYSVPYEVCDPNGEFANVTVTLIEQKNNPKTIETETSESAVDTLSVSDDRGGSKNREYTVRVDLFDTNGTVVDSRVTTSN